MLGLYRPVRIDSSVNLQREFALLNTYNSIKISNSPEKAKLVDFGCGTTRLSNTGLVSAYYIDSVNSPYCNEECDLRSLDALNSIAVAELKFDGIIANTVIQYLTEFEVKLFFELSRKILKPEGVLFIEVDNRDLLSGRDEKTGHAKYINEFHQVHFILNNISSASPKLSALVIKYLKHANIFVNCMYFSNYKKIFDQDFKILKQQVCSPSSNWQWVDEENILDNALLFRVWLSLR